MKALIIGSAGFIGSSLTKYFALDGKHELVTTDITNIDQAKSHIVINCADPKFRGLLADVRPDLIINASGSGNVQGSFSNTQLDKKLNYENVEAILEAIATVGLNAKFINLSSAAVYGTPAKLPISESQSIGAIPLSPYGEHKQRSEALLEKYYADFGLQTMSFRVFSCYGPGQRKLLMWDLYQKLKASEFKRIELFGTGQESRDYIHVYDVYRAIGLAVDKGHFDGTAINIATGTGTEISEIVKLACAAMGCEPEVVFNGESRQGDPNYWQADISKLLNLGFEPSVDLHKGIAEYYSWVKQL